MTAIFAVAVAALATPSALAQAVSGAVTVAPGITTVAGNGTAGYSGDGGPATSAKMFAPEGVAVDTAGNLYIADKNGEVVRKVDAATGIISTVAGTGTSGYSGDGGPATSAKLTSPVGVALDSAGNLYIGDTDNNRVRKVNAATGIITTVAGNGTAGYSGDGGLAISAEMFAPEGVVVDGAGNLYIADYDDEVVRKVDAATGIISTVAGTGASGYSGDGGPATSAKLTSPIGVALDSAGNLYIGDTDNNRVRKVNAATGIITTVAGNGTVGYSGDGGLATSAEMSAPEGVVVDGAGNLYIADYDDEVVRKVDAATGIISTVAGTGASGYSGDGGPATSAKLTSPVGVAFDSMGNLYIGDADNHRVRKVSTNTTVPKTAVASASTSQSVLVQLAAASAITSISVPKAQNGAQEFTVGAVTGCTVGGASNPAGTICTVPVTFSPQYPGQRTGALTLYSSGSTILGTVGLAGTGSGPLSIFSPAMTSIMSTGSLTVLPQGAAVDGAGNLFIADNGNSRIVKVTAGTASVLSTGSLTASYPQGVAVDGAGNVYIASTGSNQIIEVTAAGIASVLSTGGLNIDPQGIAVDAAGNVYVTDTANRVVKITAADGVTVLNTGSMNVSYSYGLAVDGAGNVYVADQGNNTIVKVTAAGVASVLGTGSLTLSADTGVAVDSAGDVYIADQGNSRIVEVTPSGAASVLDVGSPGGTGLGHPYGVTVDGAGSLYIADYGNNRIVKLTQAQAMPLSFASTNVGSTSSDSPQGITVQNIGNQPLDFTALDTTTAGQTSTSFNLNGAGTTCVSSTTLAPGANCGLGVEFAPLAAGSLTGTANITDNNLNAAAPNYATQQISLNGTGTGFAATIALTETPGIAVAYGTSVTVTATLTGGNGTPTGNISYTVDGASPQTAALSSGGVAQFALPGTLAVGTHSVVVSYAGDANYTAATPSQSFTLTVTAAAPSVSLTVAPSSGAAYGQTVTISATETASVGIAQGYSWSIYDGATALIQGALSNGVNGNGFAYTLATTSLSAGQHSLKAVYSSSLAGNATGTSNVVSATVAAAALTATANNATRAYGAANPTFTGTVTGAVNGDTFTESFATTATTSSNAGSYPIVPAVAGANLADYAVTATNGALTVTGAATTTTLASSATSTVAGQSVTLTATVSSGSGTPTGTVAFLNGTTSLGTGTLSGGVATLTTTTLPVGSDILTATYAAQGNYTASTSSAVTETVTAPFVVATAGNGGNITVTSGGTGTVSLSFAASPGYTGTVNLSCVTSSPAFTCSMAPPSLAFTAGGSATQTATLSITASATTADLMLPGRPFKASSMPVFSAMALWLPGSLLALFGLRSKALGKPMRRLLMLTLLCAGIGGAASLMGCGSSQSATNTTPTTTNTPAGSYTVAVKANDGTSSSTTTVNVTVQ